MEPVYPDEVYEMACEMFDTDNPSDEQLKEAEEELLDQEPESEII